MIFDELYADTLSSVSQAVQTQNLQLLQELLQNGHTTNAADNRGWTPLHVAADVGYVEGVRELLMADDIQVESLCHAGCTPLYYACCDTTESHKKVVELLLSAGADPDMISGDNWIVPLHKATENRNVDVIRMLLEAGGDPNIIGFKCGTALHSAAETGELEIAHLLLEKGGNPNTTFGEQREPSALHILCLNYREEESSNYNDMLDLFLSHSSDINAQMSDGTTPLMLAVQGGWTRAVHRLLDLEADVYLIKSNGILALHFATQYYDNVIDKSIYHIPSEDGNDQEDSSVFKKILRLTALDRIPREGYSIFHLAISWHKYEKLRILIEAGLDPDEFLQDMESAIIDSTQVCPTPLIVEIFAKHDTPLGYLLFQPLSQDIVDMAKFMIDKGSSINALKPGVLPPLVAALKNLNPTAYEEDCLGQEILQYLLARGADIMYKTRKSDLLPAALTVSSLFNVVGFFRLLQHGVPVHRIYTHSTLTALHHHYQSVSLYTAYKKFLWLVVSWIHTANLFIPQMPTDTVDIFNTGWKVLDDNLLQAWQQLRILIECPKSLQQLCVLKVRHVLGERRGWNKLQDSLKHLLVQTLLPDPILDLLYFRWVKTSTLEMKPPDSALHLYSDEDTSNIDDASDSDDEEL